MPIPNDSYSTCYCYQNYGHTSLELVMSWWHVCLLRICYDNNTRIEIICREQWLSAVWYITNVIFHDKIISCISYYLLIIDYKYRFRSWIQNNTEYFIPYWITIGVWCLGVSIITRSSDALFDEEVSKEMGIWLDSVTNAKNLMMIFNNLHTFKHYYTRIQWVKCKEC